mgnify:CR=1 FL=1
MKAAIMGYGTIGSGVYEVFAILSSGKFGFFACKRKYVVDCS